MFNLIFKVKLFPQKMNLTLNNTKIIVTVFLGLVAFSVLRCDKETIINEVELKSPSIEIISTVQESLNTYKITLEFDRGDSEEIKSLEVLFNDLTVLTNPIITKKVEINHEQNQTHIITLKTEFINHDFSVEAILKTNLYTYKSDKYILRSQKNSFSIEVFQTEDYSTASNDIAVYLNQGERFSYIIKYLNSDFRPNTMEIKLNREISINYDFSFGNYGGMNIESLGFADLPSFIEPGIYEVFLYLDGIEFKAPNKIKVLRGNWEKYETNYSDEYRGEYSWLVKGDDVFIISGNIHFNVQTQNYKVWKYNIPSNSWEEKRDFPSVPDESLVPKNDHKLPIQLEYKNQMYIAFSNFSERNFNYEDDFVEIWKYNDDDDEWIYITQYPGRGNIGLIGFISGDKLLMGGGSRHLGGLRPEIFYDYWEYDLISDKWNQKNTLPTNFARFSNGGVSCKSANNDFFYFSYANELWQYFPDDDLWQQKEKFPGNYRRVATNFIEHNNNLYIIGGLDSDLGYRARKDCWEYSIEKNKWEMVSIMPEFYANGIAFSFMDDLYAGLGWTKNGYFSFSEQNFYRLKL